MKFHAQQFDSIILSSSTRATYVVLLLLTLLSIFLEKNPGPYRIRGFR